MTTSRGKTGHRNFLQVPTLPIAPIVDRLAATPEGLRFRVYSKVQGLGFVRLAPEEHAALRQISSFIEARLSRLQ